MHDLQGMARSAILNTKEYIPGKPVEAVKRGCGMDRIIKLDTNENPLGPSPLAVEAMIREIREGSHLYPESLCPELVAKLSARFNLSAASFYMGNGADAVITMMGLTFLNPEDEVIFPGLSFPAYDGIAAKMGATRVRIPMRPDFTIDTEAMAGAVTPRTKLVFLCNPNNPTGLMTDKRNSMISMVRIPETA
nr:aminotransferase class I/II-fold pyridoxal phosphate-dependent enzyme [Desulfobacula sp.]